MPDSFVVRVGKRLAPIREVHGVNPDLEDWQQCSPAWIERALAHSQRRPTGGWFALDGVDSFGREPRKLYAAGQELVVWRDDQGALQVAPNACPHMGASMADGHVCKGELVCPWHGLKLGKGRHASWAPYRSHDDGLVLWVQLPEEGQAPSDRPVLPARPLKPLAAVMRREAACAPQDVIANRLDPWHGAYFHPHTFSQLRVIDRTDEDITVRVSYRLLGKLGVEVDARFHTPDARTIVMTITGGDGVGSVVETHATPTTEGRTAIVEAVLATSERPAFGWFRDLAGPLVRPLMRAALDRLWVEDAAYAERRAELRASAPARHPKRVRA